MAMPVIACAAIYRSPDAVTVICGAADSISRTSAAS